MERTMLPQAESARNAGHRVSPVNDIRRTQASYALLLLPIINNRATHCFIRANMSVYFPNLLRASGME
jgi:hypothetical protein